MSARDVDNAKTMFRALITQTNEDGSIKEINGIKLIGGVIQDRIGKALGYVYQEDKYNDNMERKPENFVYNWYVNEENKK
jgi:hypothetical protein